MQWIDKKTGKKERKFMGKAKLKAFQHLSDGLVVSRAAHLYCVCGIQKVAWAAESPDVMIDGEYQCRTISLPADSK